MLYPAPIVFIQNKSNMEYRVFETDYNGKQFRIEEDFPEVGVYLYVFQDGKCIIDDLQNDIETCKQIAFEDFQVPLNNWVQKNGIVE